MATCVDKQASRSSDAFSDRRLMLASPFHPNLACVVDWHSTSCEVQQSYDGPKYLVIGPSVADQSLLRASERFGIPLRGLMEFRAATVKAVIRRTAKQTIAHVGVQRFCVCYLKNGREHRFPWFNSRSRAHLARELLSDKYGSAIVYVD